MRKCSTKKAFTLIELIVALALVSVIILGITSINLVLGNNNQDYGQRYLVKSATQTTLNHILNNASLAVGSGTTINGSLDIGILIGTGNAGNPGMGDANTFCIHQDPNSTPGNYIDDIWFCYTWTLATHTINYCTMNFVANNPNRGAASCNGGALLSGPIFLGTSFSNPVTSASFLTTAGSQMVFTDTIQNCLDDSAATCFSATPDPVNNPEVQITGSVNPLQEGQQQS